MTHIQPQKIRVYGSVPTGLSNRFRLLVMQQTIIFIHMLHTHAERKVAY